MSDSVRVVACPTCRAPVRWEPQSQFRPFCSKRCRLIDLGEWATESYRVPAQEESPSEASRGE
ncbi:MULTISPECIES: DNA gyrase inhibitor YacG [Chromobacterium]|uniref:DNA gyrase inhibitor YacG n=1 Tax=Chromobacterium aquaticum TaxID=467180 RepID=A0ABV8ZP87_9NEIS|nr:MULTISPECIES: DNA gyrase inhibitor YacG [Chromobacterium]RBH50573.1 DNA gyrase inhibitor YacG [Pseudomonas sp. MWU13-2860]KMN35875.1 DNA gyrase inhibitor [Chromobacterium sp. LK1]KMN81773.1 DNA gyrase inhibitor [Chromobacterium sp. LK11]MBN3002667.1 DNA gyrase inhibitor YacG [Chromobacterium alkanivorans]MCD5362304.1 DNA gyrase inhibitor YacG [Chromobacterium aquaticum]